MLNLRKKIHLNALNQLFMIGVFLLPMRTLLAQEHINFKHLTIDEGLSQNTVFCTVQDKAGFIWIGTEDGLNKYDGYEFTIYKHENNNPKSLSHSQINTLFEDPKGNLWIGTADGLNLFSREEESFTRINTDVTGSKESNDFITSFLYDSKGNLWFGTYDGLKRYDYTQKKVISYQLSTASGNTAGSNRIQTIFEDNDGKFWISMGKDLIRFDPVNKKILPLPALLSNNLELKRSNVRAIKKGKNGTYWFGTESSGLFKYDSVKDICIHYEHEPKQPSSLPVSIVRALFFRTDQELWIGTRDGLSVLNVQTEKFTNYDYDPYNPESLSHNSVRHMMQDREGNVWLGTYAGGLNIFSASSANFAHVGEAIGKGKGLTHRFVSAIVKADRGAFWIGTEGGGLNYIDRDRGIYKNFVIKSKQQDIIKSLAKDNQDNLWIGTYDGLTCFHIKEGTFTDYDISENDEQPENKQVFALAVQPDGVWLGTDGRGLKFLDHQDKITTYLQDPRNPHSVSGNVITSLLQDEQNLWVGTDRGLSYYDSSKKIFTQFSHQAEEPYSISHNAVLSLFYDAKHRLWVGTKGGGLNLYDASSGRFYNVGLAFGIANGVIHAIREDLQGNLWISTNKGLSKLTFHDLQFPLTKEMVTVMNYAVSDGLQSNQFASGAAEIGEHGELLFGGINGITTFFPDKIISNTFKPRVEITDLLIRNNPVTIHTDHTPLQKPIGETEKITLTHDQAFITLKFAALNFINPDKNEYAYRLVGFYDDDWHYVKNQRMATYTNLDAGRYIFQVKAANNDGLWNEQVKSLRITVLPPWWKTWWANLLYVVVIGALLYFFYYYSLKTAKLKNELAFEHKSHEKDQELAQRKLSFFTNISHEIKTPLTLILAPIEKLLGMNEGNNKIQNQLMLMQRNGERLLRLINQLLDFRKFESGNVTLQAAEGNMVRFIREILMAFESYASHRKIELKLVPDEPRIRVWFDRDKFEKVIYNVLSNALKFTPEGGQIIVRIKRNSVNPGESVLIEVEDNGVGIPAHRINKIFEQFNHYNDSGINADGTGIGLAFSKELVALHHGNISVESTVASNQKQGKTCFTIMLPLGNTHLSDGEVIQNYKDSENIEGYRDVGVSEVAKLAMENRKQQVLHTADKEKLILLVVEDNADVLEFIASHFENDFEIHKASNGLKGMELAFNTIPDIIISDVMMPEMNGISLCKELKSDTRTSHIPIILLTARTPLIFKIEGLETGADDYITKPFNLSVLEARIWNLLESRQKLRDRYSKEVTLQPRNIAITSPDEKFIEKVMHFIESNMAEPSLSVEELGKEVGMSRVTLYRKIKALTNQTAIEFIRSVRLNRAAQLLAQHKLNVNEVAYMVGFLDIDYFRRCFKEQFGLTPKEYANAASDTDPVKPF